MIKKTLRLKILLDNTIFHTILLSSKSLSCFTINSLSIMQTMQVYGMILNIRIIDHTAFIKLNVQQVVKADGTKKMTNQIARFSLAFGENTLISESTINLMFEGDMITMYLEQTDLFTYATVNIKVKNALTIGDAISEAIS